MDITIQLSDREVGFLRKLMDEQKALAKQEYTMEDAIHECIRDSMFDMGETLAQEEFE